MAMALTSRVRRPDALQVNEATMNALVEGANGDLRAILGQLQMIRLRKRTLAYDDVKGKMGTSKVSPPASPT